MKTLGLNISGYITSAALVEDGEILAASCEERFSRKKRDRAFPLLAAKDALERTGLRPDELDAVAIGWNPGRNMSRDFDLRSSANRLRAEYLAYVPNAMARLLGGPPGETTIQEVLSRRVIYVDHHLAHAASTCFTSPWESGAVVTIDAFGEEDSLTVGRFAGNNIEVLERVRFPHSLGSFYSYITEFLGFRADSDEYKVMALGAFADPKESERVYKRMRSLYRIGSEGRHLRFELDLSRFDFYLFHRAHDFGPLSEILGLKPRGVEDALISSHFAVAAALQRCFEEIVKTVLLYAKSLTNESRVALAGGCFMNSVANGKLEGEDAIFQEVHIPPYPDDSGVAIGAALFVNLNGSDARRREYRHNFFGPEVTSAEAESALARYKIPSLRLVNPHKTIARLIAEGEIVAYAGGAMEFGQRALGNRSIFADPTDPDIRAKVNERVKRREWFRPYAASVLAEKVDEVFEAPKGFHAYFMEKVRRVRPEWADRIRGILHADQSVRLHTVSEDTNKDLYELISEFERLKGVPLVLNTSFNVAEMPIVCDVEDAVVCFFSSGLDSLVIGDRLVRKAFMQTPMALE